MNKTIESITHPDIEYSSNFDLSKLMTMRLKVTGKVFTVKSIEALKYLLPTLNQNNISYKLVGLGANQVLSGEGLYIKLKFPFDKSILDSEKNEYELPSSVSLTHLVNHAKKFNLKDWEFMTGIPATLGGAVFMNAGISSGEIKEIIKSVLVITPTGEARLIAIDESSFSYRKNHFVKKGEVIVQVTLKNNGHVDNLAEKIENYLNHRSQTQPWKDKTCGCVFKNASKTCTAGHCIDIINLKGFTYKGIKISHLHGNFFVNYKEATPEDFMTFIKIIQNELYLQIGVKFDFEVQLS